jgi:DNA-binding XRE family transcriptional regulator
MGRTRAGVFGSELRYYRTRAGLLQKDLAARAIVSRDVINKIETGDRPPAEDFPARLDAIPGLDTSGALDRLWGHLKKSMKQRAYRRCRGVCAGGAGAGTGGEDDEHRGGRAEGWVS